MHRTDQRTPRRLSLSLALQIDPTLSSFLRFKAIIPKLNRYNMKRNTSCKLVELLHLLTMHLAGNFSSYLLSLSHKNKLICELQNHRVLELTSHPALDPCPVQLGREPKWRQFDALWRGIKIRGFNQFKTFLHHITWSTTCILAPSLSAGVKSMMA